MSSNSSSPSKGIDFTKYGTSAALPEDKIQYIVQTPYGRAMVVRTVTKDDSQNMRELELLDWTSGSNRPATLYSPTEYPSVPVKVGDDVVTLYGRGVVEDIKDTDDAAPTAVVKLSSWRLAERSRVKCYINTADTNSNDSSQLRVVRSKRVYEMNVFERVEYATQLKNQASKDYFSKKQYLQALSLYTRALDVLRYVQHNSESTNHVRAELLILMITISNNAATCCMHLISSGNTNISINDKKERYEDQAYTHAKSACLLIESLQERSTTSKIFQILQKDGYSRIKIFGEFYVKSLLLQGKALTQKHETGPAIQVLKKAHEVIASYTTSSNGDTRNDESYQKSLQQLLSNAKEVKRLHMQCKEERKAQLQKEKLRAQAMFSSVSDNSKQTGSNSFTESDTASLEGEKTTSEKETPSNGDNSTSETASILKHDSSDEPHIVSPSPSTEAEKSEKRRRKVSFADELDLQDITKAHEKPLSNAIKNNGGDGTDEWDSEVIAGLGIAAVCAVGAAVAMNYFINFMASRNRA